jgi:hypothetical protein
MRLPILFALACAAVACGSSQEDGASTAEAYSKFEGTDFVRAGWTAKALLDGHADWQGATPEYSGRLVAAPGGFLDVFQDPSERTGILVADPSSEKANPIPLDPGYISGNIIGALGSSIAFDRGGFAGSTRLSNALMFSQLTNGAWKRETIDNKLGKDGPTSTINSLCLVERGGVKTAVYVVGWKGLRMAERTDAGWKVQNLDPGGEAAGAVSCAVSGTDLYILVGTGTHDHDPLRVLHQVAGGAVTVEPVSAPASGGDHVFASTISVDAKGTPWIAFTDKTLHLSKRSADGTWPDTAVAVPFDPSPARTDIVPSHNLALSFAGDDAVIFAIAAKNHPTERGSKDELWTVRQGAGGSAASQVEAYSPASRVLKVTGSVVNGSKATVGLIETQIGGDFRHLVISGSL